MRTLANSLFGGGFAALLLGETLFLLNPQVPLTPMNLARVGGGLVLTYGVAVGIGLWLAVLLFEEVREHPLQPAWFSFRLMTWLLVVDLGILAAVTWHNLFYYRLYLSSPAIRSLALYATVLSGAAAVLLVLGLFQYSFGRRAVRAGYGLVVAAALSALIVPLYVRSPAPRAASPFPRLPLEDAPSLRHVTILGIEGASLSYLLPAIADGRLPHFARLVEGGASGPLRTLRPTESLAVWTSMATGKLPRQHALSGFYRYRFPGIAAPFTLLPHGAYLQSLERIGLLRRSAMTSNHRRSLPFWTILSRFGVRLGLVRWWGSYPAEEVDGFVVSELLHRQVLESFDPPLPDLTFPRHLLPELSSSVASPEELTHSDLQSFLDFAVDVPGDKPEWSGELKRALAEDATYVAIGRRLRELYDPQVFAMYLFGLDIVGHNFLRFYRPESFGDVSDEELRKYGRVIDAYYHHLDTILGELLRAKRPDEILVVVSGHGMEPLPLARRIVEAVKGNAHLSGYHENAPDGLVLFYGPGIARGAKLSGASVVDLTPTLLYLMGLPLGRDMDGTLLASVLEPSLIRSQPVTYISSYRNFLIEPRKEDEQLAAPSPLDALPGLLDVRE